MNVLWETMIAEMRAERSELDNRRHFTAEGKPIELIRALMADWTEVQPDEDLEAVAVRTATNLTAASRDDLFDVG